MGGCQNFGKSEPISKGFSTLIKMVDFMGKKIEIFVKWNLHLMIFWPKWDQCLKVFFFFFQLNLFRQTLAIYLLAVYLNMRVPPAQNKELLQFWISH